MGEVQFAFRIDEERRNELAEMARETGMVVTSIARGALYAALDKWKKDKTAAE